MARDRKRIWTRLIFLAVAGAALLQSGCAVLAVGAAATAAGAGGYAYYKGQVNRGYPARVEDVRAAAHTALKELGMPVVGETPEADGVTLESTTATGDPVRIFLMGQQPKIPADGPATQVGIRVNWFGDLEVSDRILDQIGYHLAPPGQAAAATAAAGATPVALSPRPQTAPPPLAPEPVWRPKPEAK